MWYLRPVAQSTDCVRGKKSYTRCLTFSKCLWFEILSGVYTPGDSDGQKRNEAHMLWLELQIMNRCNWSLYISTFFLINFFTNPRCCTVWVIAALWVLASIVGDGTLAGRPLTMEERVGTLTSQNMHSYDLIIQEGPIPDQTLLSRTLSLWC